MDELVWRKCIRRCPLLIHRCLHMQPFTKTQQLTNAQGPGQDPTASILRFLSSLPIDCCCILWLDWTTPDNHLPSLVFLLSSLPPSSPLSPCISSTLPHQRHSHVCLSLAFISPAYWTLPLASEWSFDGAAPRHKSIFTPFTYFSANKLFALSSILRA